MKKIVFLLLTVATLVSLVGCSEKSYQFRSLEFKDNGVSLTLTEAFEKSDTDPFPGSYSVYKSEDAAVILYRNYVGEKNAVTLEDYTKLWIAANIEYRPETVKELEGFTATTVTSVGEDKIEYKYYTALYKGKDSFWVVQFMCPSEDYREYSPHFEKWATKIKPE